MSNNKIAIAVSRTVLLILFVVGSFLGLSISEGITVSCNAMAITSANDTVPDPFIFDYQTGVVPNTVVTSNAIKVSGIDAATSVSITGGTYSINGGVYTNINSTVNNGDTVTVQLTSSKDYLTMTQAILTIGGVSNTFIVTTLEIKNDFDGNGKPDILWRSEKSGDNVVWYYDGTTFISSASLGGPKITGSSWKIEGIADFDGNGKPDILWRSEKSGDNVVWCYDGTTFISSASLGGPKITDASWKIAGIADFDGNGKPDILWRSETSGDNVVWYYDGTTFISSASLGGPKITGTSWKIAGIADFDGNGKPDILWRSETSGDNVVWYYDGTTFISSASLGGPKITGSSWKIAGIADFDGNGKPDILWRSEKSGDNGVWYYDKTSFMGFGILDGPKISDSTWKVVGDNYVSDPVNSLDAGMSVVYTWQSFYASEHGWMHFWNRTDDELIVERLPRISPTFHVGYAFVQNGNLIAVDRMSGDQFRLDAQDGSFYSSTPVVGPPFVTATHSFKPEINQVAACPIAGGVCKIISIYEGSIPFVFAEHNGRVLAATNYGDVLIFDGTNWCRTSRSGDTYRCDPNEPMVTEPRIVQFYSSINYMGKTFVGEWPTGRLYEFDGIELRPADIIQPPFVTGEKIGYEAQSIAEYSGDLFVGYWPRGEIWRRHRTTGEWLMVARLFSHPVETEPFIPYLDQEEEGLLRGFYGQRVSVLIPYGDSLYAFTSNLGGWPVGYESTILTQEQAAEYGAVYRLKIPGCLTIEEIQPNN